MSEIKKIDIVMFNMSPYTDWQQGIVNRNYHILQALARDERIGKIIAVDFLPIGFSFARKAKYFYRNLIKGVVACDAGKNLCLGGETKFGDLTSRCYQITSKIYVYSSVDSLARVTQELGEISKRLKLQNLIIWSYNPLIANLVEIKKQLNAKTVVFDAVDDWSSHSAYENKKELLQKNYQQIQNQTDLIFTVSQELKEKLFNNLDKVHWIPNGVDLDHFLKVSNQFPEELQNIQQPIIGYAGVIQDRLDIDLIKYLAEKNRDKSFVFVGWLWRGLDEIINKKFVDLDNVYFLGRRTYDELPNYLQAFKVGIIPHKVNDLTKSMNPLKMYEYLACGKPIVSTEVAGVDDFGKFIKIAKNEEEFNQMINESLVEDSEDLKKQRIEVVKKHSWDNRMQEMMLLLSKN